ncbi:universal stress protein [Salinimicrobium sediminilitoris]|uniref:universal stress protein n=1 Tax=Salinimicrobium sediminilitoris TaxID=2876715 RepID=UPI001E43AF3A|nr:universal stress protein [Salinimicrobium sediminilitoris]MCC8360681.1 universal stress protein [Salinimicrobium sediminilitoris]
MKNVLVLTDFSETANLASDIGLAIAGKLKTGITFLHLVSTPVEWRKLPLEKENLYPETKAAIGDAKDKLFSLERKAHDMEVEAHTSLVYDAGMEEIYGYINEKNYCLVLIGTHGEKGRNKTAGTNTLRVLHKSPVPVIAVKLGANPNVPQKWVIVSDFLEKSRESFNRIMDLAKKLGAAVQILYVNTPYFFEETTGIHKKLEPFTAPYSKMQIKPVIINAYNEERGIDAYVNSYECDLVSVITHGRSGLNPVFRRNITEKILNHLDLPLMNINADL